MKDLVDRFESNFSNNLVGAACFGVMHVAMTIDGTPKTPFDIVSLSGTQFNQKRQDKLHKVFTRDREMIAPIWLDRSVYLDFVDRSDQSENKEFLDTVNKRMEQRCVYFRRQFKGVDDPEARISKMVETVGKMTIGEKIRRNPKQGWREFLEIVDFYMRLVDCSIYQE